MSYLEKVVDILATKEKAPAVVSEQARAKDTDSHSIKKRKALTADDSVIQAFRRGEWLTDWDAHQKHGCSRFRTLMSELRQRGWLFYDEWVEGENRYKNPARWKRYKLLKAGA